MAGYIFSVAKSLMNEVKEENIKRDISPLIPQLLQKNICR